MQAIMGETMCHCHQPRGYCDLHLRHSLQSIYVSIYYPHLVVDIPIPCSVKMNPSTDETADAQTLRQSRELDADLKPKASQTSQWGPPESVAKLSQEERIAAERRLKRKIDFRLLPALVIMYILSNSFYGVFVMPQIIWTGMRLQAPV